MCESEEQKKAILKHLGVPVWEAFVNGRKLEAELGL